MSRFANILFIANLQEDDDFALEQAVKFARQQQARLTVATLIENASLAMLPEAVVDYQRNRLLDQIDLLPTFYQNIQVQVLAGREFSEVMRDVDRNKRDLVIKPITNRPAGLLERFDMKLLRKSPCPIWLVQSDNEEGSRPILVAPNYETDDVENESLNIRMLDGAIEVALTESRELHIVHAWELAHEDFHRSGRTGLSKNEVDFLISREQQVREKWLSALVEQCWYMKDRNIPEHPVTSVELIQGKADVVLPECIERLNADMFVLGALGHAGIRGLFINDAAEAMLQRVCRSMLSFKSRWLDSPTDDGSAA